ncbi:PEP-CTERM sorting domain-containing protein [Aeoliella sp. SH292]|uniref:PEP-CTERM sorting domain-containing protein n=1 Tax=Aeoliella sp. SH292 TaxID=3454464 RepID=UPI003F9D7349
MMMGKTMHKVFLAMAIVVGMSNVNAASILDFSQNDVVENQNFAGSGYGNNLPETPNVTLEWGVGLQHYNNWNGRGASGQLDFGDHSGSTIGGVIQPPSNGAPINVVLTPEAGYGVYLTSFDLDTWAGGSIAPNGMNVGWELLSGPGVLYSGVYSLPVQSGGNRTAIITGMTEADAISTPLTLRYTLNSGDGTYLATDNIAFGQVTAIPEPATVALLAIAGGALVIAGRRRWA